MKNIINTVSNVDLFRYSLSPQYPTNSLVFLCIAVLFITATTAITSYTKDIHYANASGFLDLNLDQNIEQFQDNLQQSIEEQLQSSINSTNYIKNGCEGNNGVNVAIQSQTNMNGQSSSIMQNYCTSLNSISFPNKNINLAGQISTAEYDTGLDYILNSILGNWSLTNNQKEPINFQSFFIKLPVFYKLSSPLIENFTQNLDRLKTNQSFEPTAQVRQQQQQQQQQQQSNTISYNLSEFRVSSINFIDSHQIFEGKVDVIKQTISNQTGEIIYTNTFHNVPISLAIYDNKTLIINFNKQTDLFNDFKNTPLVGVVLSR